MGDTLTVGKVIKMPCMRKGLCAYPNETILVGQDALAQLAPTALGVPVVIEHPEQQITAENIGTLPVQGRVSGMEYDQANDLWIVEFVLDRQEGVDLLTNGWGVSTAWFGDEYRGGATLNNVSYDRELVAGRYEHLAIVQRPRYEMAKGAIFLNSQPLQSDTQPVMIEGQDEKPTTHTGVIPMIGKIFKKIVSKNELKLNEGEEICIEIEGEEIPLSKIAEVLKAAKGPKKQKLSDEDEVEVEGEKMTVNELKSRYQAAMGKGEKPAEEKPEEKKEAAKDSEEKPAEKTEDKPEEKPAEKKENEDKPEDKPEDKKENSVDPEVETRFNSIKETHENALPQVVTDFVSMQEKVEMGKKRYGKR